MKQQQELTVITKTYDLILWTCNHTRTMGVTHLFVVLPRFAPSCWRAPFDANGLSGTRKTPTAVFGRGFRAIVTWLATPLAAVPGVTPGQRD